jgi:hypothetical protein
MQETSVKTNWSAVTIGAIVVTFVLVALCGLVALLSFHAGRSLLLLFLFESVPALCFLLLLPIRTFRARLKSLPASFGPRKHKRQGSSELSIVDAAVGIFAIPTIIFGLLPIILILGSLLKWDKDRINQRIAFLVLAWCSYNLCLAYVLAVHHKFGMSITLSLMLAIIAISATASGLGTKNGVLKLFDYLDSPMTPGTVLAYALSFAGAFGCLHFNIWMLNNAAYNGLHDWQDSLYFSIVTLATVGYGDVTPLSHIARWACMVEIVMGFVILIVALNTTMSVWMQRTQPPLPEAMSTDPKVVFDSQVPVPVERDHGVRIGNNDNPQSSEVIEK